MRKGNRAVSRWLFDQERPPPGVRLAFGAATLALLGATYAATQSEGLQVLVLFALVFVVLPALSRRYGRRDEVWDGVHRKMPWRVVGPSLAVLAAWCALLLFVPDLGLGPWFWWWALLWPPLEVLVYLAERDLRRNSAGRWNPFRPLRDSALLGLSLVALITVTLLLEDDSLVVALAYGLGCGVIVAVLGCVAAWGMRRAHTAPTPRR